MNKNTLQSKIQQLVIKQFLEKGHIKLLLPGGTTLEMGIVQEGKDGKLIKTDDYCWIIANQDNRSISMDTYNLGLKYLADDDKMVFEHDVVGDNGQQLKALNIV